MQPHPPPPSPPSPPPSPHAPCSTARERKFKVECSGVSGFLFRAQTTLDRVGRLEKRLESGGVDRTSSPLQIVSLFALALGVVMLMCFCQADAQKTPSRRRPKGYRHHTLASDDADSVAALRLATAA